MFGYVKPQKEELLVKDLALWRAVYCGLCSEIKKNISFFIPFSLSYDFVFLAMARDAITGEKPNIINGRCCYNPFKKKKFVSSTGVKFASVASLILIEKNLEDKKADKDLKLLSPFLGIAILYLKRKIKKLSKDEKTKKLFFEISSKLDDFSRLEEKGSDTDSLCEGFGKVMGKLLSFGLEKDAEKIAEALGCAVGGFLYLADALDDCEKDLKKGHFNPLINEYRTPCEIAAHAMEIDIVFASFARDAHLALSLLPKNPYSGINENIVTKGLGAEAFRIFTRLGGKDERSL